jgi:hypothetical protein
MGSTRKRSLDLGLEAIRGTRRAPAIDLLRQLGPRQIERSAWFVRRGRGSRTPLISVVPLKSIRLGFEGYQHCPVGKDWSMVTPIPVDQLSEAERIEAARVHDIHIP